MAVLIWIIIIGGTTVWMGFDAAERDFSQSRFARSTVQWVVGGIFLWIVAFPAYLVLRGRVPRKHAAIASVDGWTPPNRSVPPPSGSVPPPSWQKRPERP